MAGEAYTLDTITTYLNNAKATICSFTEDPVVIEF